MRLWREFPDLILEFERDVHLRLILPSVDAGDFHADLVDLRPVDVVERRLRAVHRVVDRVFDTVLTRADEGDFLEDHG